MFHGGVGALFGTVASRPHRNSGLFPLLFILSALVSGGALLAVVAGIFQDGFSKNRGLVLDLGKLVLGLLALDVVFQISEFLVVFRSGIHRHTAGLRLVLFGPFWEVFWYGQLLLGTVVPLILLASCRLPKSSPRLDYGPAAYQPWTSISLALALLGALRAALRNRTDLALENLALRQQLALLGRRSKRPQFGRLDRAFWV